jgi:hypothetical protein
MPIVTARFVLALCLLALAATLLMIGMWQGTTGTSPPTSAPHGGGVGRVLATTQTSMLTPYIPIIMIMSPLITATFALIGVFWSSRLAERQRLRDEERRRQALATFLLGEIHVLHIILEDINQAYYVQGLHRVAIEPFHTTMYDQAGGDRLLFQAETAQVLARFYTLVSTLRTELTKFREHTPESRRGEDDALRARTLYVAGLIEEVTHKLSAEGGAWSLGFPTRGYMIYQRNRTLLPFHHGAVQGRWTFEQDPHLRPS